MIPSFSNDIQLVLVFCASVLFSVTGFLIVRALSRFDRALDSFAEIVQNHERRIAQLEGFCRAQHVWRRDIGEESE